MLIAISFRLEKEIKELLKYICKYDGRSQTKEIEQLIKKRYDEIIEENSKKEST